MNVTTFCAEGFRNLCDVDISPCDGINVIYGDNGQGKTNLLEGIGLFSGMKSFRGARNCQMIRRGAQFSRLKMDFFAQEREQTARMNITEQTRELTLNGVKKEAASAMMGVFCTVVFSPDRMSLVTGGANERRRFVDAAISQFSPKYVSILYKFNQILQQRNILLKDIAAKPSLASTLDVWDMSLASYGSAVICRRDAFIRRLSPAAGEIYDGISAGREPLRLRYGCSFARDILKTAAQEAACESEGFSLETDEGVRKKVEEAYFAQLAESRQSDMKLGFTFHGPQRDDVDIIINEADARIYGSQGQKRSAVLALKLAESSVLSSMIGEQPVALLDDVMSELDSSRQDFLLNRLKGWQVFITCCDPGPLRLLDSGRIFHVESGRVARI